MPSALWQLQTEKMLDLKTSEITSALLSHIYNAGGSVKSSDVYEQLGIALGLSKVEMVKSLDEIQGHGGNSSKWENMVRWARNSLAEEGYLLRPNQGAQRGVWMLTDQGKLAAKLLNALEVAPPPATYPDEVPEAFPEGARYTALVNAYERNPKGRAKCLAHHGYRCAVCNFDFEERYGPRGKRFIHVHHLVPLASIGQMYSLDPVADLRPVCPNCHAMLHRTDPPCSIAELIAMLKQPAQSAASETSHHVAFAENSNAQ